MSQENVELVKRFVDAYNRRDVEAMLNDLDPEIEWHSGILTALGRDAAVYRGHDGFRQGLRDIYEALGETQIEYSEIRDLGSRTLAIGRFRARGRGSGAEIDSPNASVADFKNGKAVRIRTYFDREEALEAAGLRE